MQTYYRWRKKYGGLMPSEMKRLKQFEEENQRLKRLVADLSLEDARSKCEAWRSDYNTVRPHSSISQKTPIELAKTSGPACWP